MIHKNKPIPITLINLGCPKNLVDSEHLLTYLAERGFILEHDPLSSCATLLNTCCFIDDAKEESIGKILEAVQIKKINPGNLVLVFGCMPVKYGSELRVEIPEVDFYIEGSNPAEIHRILASRLLPENLPSFSGTGKICNPARLWLETPHYAYLKIAEGCDYRCSFCVIPQIRGPYRSIPREQLVTEAQALIERNVKELILVAQHTTSYGRDLNPPGNLVELLKSLDDLEGDFWIRILYTYPNEIDDDLLRTMAKSKKICHYLDIPIQHSHPDILRRMRRPDNREALLGLFRKIRQHLPHIALRTTVLVGFPGETEEHLEDLMEFIGEVRFTHLGCFPFSPQSDTPAADFSDQVPKETREHRAAQIINLQRDIVNGFHETLIGSSQTILVEEQSSQGPYPYSGRASFQAPEIDGLVYIRGNSLKCGDFSRIKIEDFDLYDLYGSDTNQVVY